MFVNVPVEWSYYLEHCWELVFHHALYERRRDPVSSVDSSSRGWIPKLSPLREPKRIVGIQSLSGNHACARENQTFAQCHFARDSLNWLYLAMYIPYDDFMRLRRPSGRMHPGYQLDQSTLIPVSRIGRSEDATIASQVVTSYGPSAVSGCKEFPTVSSWL